MVQLQCLVLAAGLMAATSHVSAAKNDTKNPFTQDFAKFVAQNMDVMKVPGAAIAVVDGDDVFTQGFGYASLPDKKVTPDTLFLAGSTTKAQTALCLSYLIQNVSHEALAKNWSTPISSVLKGDFVVQDQWATEHLTLDDAVSHRTGFYRDDRDLRRDLDGKPLSTKEIVRSIRNLPYYAEPRVQFKYSNWPYIALSYVIEVVTKKPLGQVMRELLWNPLGMKSTYFGLEEALKEGRGKLATGYSWVNATQKYNKTAYMPMTDVSGAAAVVSNARDYAKYLQGLLNQTHVIPESVQKDIRTPRTIANPEPQNEEDIRTYSLGWFRSTYQGRVLYWHDGSMIGFMTLVMWFPEEKFGLAVFGNSDSAEIFNMALLWELIANHFATPQADRVNHTAAYIKNNSKGKEQRIEEQAAVSYPDRPKEPVAPSFNVSALAGTYSNKESGNMTLLVDPHDRKMLIADRPSMTWHYRLNFNHIYADKWIASQYRLENTGNLLDAFPAQFVKGDGDKPTLIFTSMWATEETEQMTHIKANITFERLD